MHTKYNNHKQRHRSNATLKQLREFQELECSVLSGFAILCPANLVRQFHGGAENAGHAKAKQKTSSEAANV